MSIGMLMMRYMAENPKRSVNRPPNRPPRPMPTSKPMKKVPLAAPKRSRDTFVTARLCMVVCAPPFPMPYRKPLRSN